MSLKQNCGIQQNTRYIDRFVIFFSRVQLSFLLYMNKVTHACIDFLALNY